MPVVATGALDPTMAIIMLAGIYYGAMYGGSTTAILVNIPGEVSSVVTTFDGYQLARQGKAGVALAIAAISSFVAGTLSLVGLTFFAPPLARFALAFGPPEYFALALLAFTMVIGLSGASLLKGVMAALAGVLVMTVGSDPLTATPRFTFGSSNLLVGFNLVPVVIGLFAISGILANSEEIGRYTYHKIERLYPTLRELRECTGPTLRSTVVGFFLGLLPGCTAGAISFMSYELERRISPLRDKFGKGALQGVAVAEGANNAATSGGFVPLFSLGLPTAPALAVLLNGLMIYGLEPGPLLFREHPAFVWAIIASMYIGNVMLLVLNLPLVGLWARVASIPYKYLAPMVLAFCFVGAYGMRNNMFDVWVMIIFGIVGYVMRKLKYPMATMVLGLILGPVLEQSFRQSLGMTGSLLIFVSRPISVGFLVAAALVVVLSLLSQFRYRRAPV